MIRLLNERMKILPLIILLMALASCKRDYNCVCHDYDLATGRTTTFIKEVFHDTERGAKKECAELWCGDECNCSIE
jgi:hypothetical protein